MGMDSYIFLAHSKKELDSENFWNNNIRDFDEETKWTTPGERWYARKFWSLHDHLVATCFHNEYECGDWIELNREDIEEMISYSTHHANYFDNFCGLENLCEILYHWDDIQDAGLHPYYECDW